MYFYVGGDLVDLISLADSDYEVTYQVPSTVDPELSAALVVQTAQKMRQVVYGKIEGTLNSLLSISSGEVAKMQVGMDLGATIESGRQREAQKIARGAISGEKHSI